MRKVAVIGGGHTKFMTDSPNTSIELAAEASMDAIAQANLTPKDIPSVTLFKCITPLSCRWIMVSLLTSIGAFQLFHVSIFIFMAGIILSLLFYTIGVRLFYHRVQYYFRTVGIFAIMITGVMTFLLLLAFLFPAV